MPGWAADGPFRLLVRSIAEASQGASDARALAAVEQVRSLAVAGVAALRAAPLIRDWDNSATDPLLPRPRISRSGWRPLYVTEVGAALASIGIHPVGSAMLEENFDNVVLTRPARDALGPIDAPDLRELVRYHFLFQRFRRDVFVRQPRRLEREGRRERLLEMRFALSRPAARVTYEYRTEAGKVGFDNVISWAIVSALAESATSAQTLVAPNSAKAI